LGIRSRDAYHTRHTYATLALMAGSNPAYIARQLGHATTAMVFQKYSGWIDGGDNGHEARKLNAVFERSKSEFFHISSTGGPRPKQGQSGKLKFIRNLSADAAIPQQRKLVTPTGIEPVFSP